LPWGPWESVAPEARIVNVSSGVGPLARNADPAFPYREIFGTGYSASKTAMNAMTLAMAIELEPTGIKVNAVSAGFIRRTSTTTGVRRLLRRALARLCGLRC